MAATRPHPGALASLRLSPLLQLPSALRRSFLSTAANLEVYDVVCIGGGPAGLSLLSALRAHPSTRRLKIALVDGQTLTPSRPAAEHGNYSNRCSSLTPASLAFLRESGPWDKIDVERVQPYHGMEVWDGVSGAKIRFDPQNSNAGFGGGLLDAVGGLVPGSRFQASRRRDDAQLGSNAVATMCENANLTSGLLQHLEEAGGVEILDQTKVESIQLGEEPSEDETSLDLSQWPIIHLPNLRQLAARLLVGADGANSPVRSFANIPSNGWDYGQHGVVATLNLDRQFDIDAWRMAYQRFLPTGPIALLPLPGGKASLVWSISAPFASQLKSLAPADFANMVNAAFRLQQVDLNYLLTHLTTANIEDELAWRFPQTSAASTDLPTSMPQVMSVQEGSVASFPLRMRHAATYTDHRVALIGDAAHTVHPLAGQGLNLGLADAKSLAAQIAYGMEHGMDIGTSWCLDAYNSERWAANNAVMGVCDKLQKLYSAESGPVVWGRSFGLNLVDKLGPLKGMLMGAAGGAR